MSFVVQMPWFAIFSHGVGVWHVDCLIDAKDAKPTQEDAMILDWIPWGRGAWPDRFSVHVKTRFAFGGTLRYGRDLSMRMKFFAEKN